jgi:hypothetical protein
VDLAELIAAWHTDGRVDGFHLTPAESPRDLERLVNGTVALLQHRGLFRTFYPGSTLREHLDLARPASGMARRTPVGPAGRPSALAPGARALEERAEHMTTGVSDVPEFSDVSSPCGRPTGRSRRSAGTG